MIDARVLDRWPTAWRERIFFDPHTNHNIARQVAAQIAYGRDTERLASVWATMENELKGARSKYEAAESRAKAKGISGKREIADEVRKEYPSVAEYERGKRMAELEPLIANSKESLREFYNRMDSDSDALKFTARLGQFIAFGMLNNPGTALVNLADLFSPFFIGGASGKTMAQSLRSWKFLGEGVVGSLGQAVGLDLLKSSRLQTKWVEEGYNDAATDLDYVGRYHAALGDGAPRGFEEGKLSRGMRIWMRAQGATFTKQGGRFTAFRPFAPFQQFVQETMRASTLSAWHRVEDMTLQVMKHMQDLRITSPTYQADAAAMGLTGGDAAAFEAMRVKLLEGYGLDVSKLARDALARGASAGGDRNQILTRRDRALIHGFVATEQVLEGNIASMTPKAWTSSAARFFLPLWGWPIRRAMQLTRLGLDPQDKHRGEAIARGVLALAVIGAAGLAMSMVSDWYHEYIVGRKRNLRSVANIPAALRNQQYTEAFMSMTENLNRAGTFGVFGEVINLATNIGHGGGFASGWNLYKWQYGGG
jgi:hypothetical protein